MITHDVALPAALSPVRLFCVGWHAFEMPPRKGAVRITCGKANMKFHRWLVP